MSHPEFFGATKATLFEHKEHKGKHKDHKVAVVLVHFVLSFVPFVLLF